MKKSNASALKALTLAGICLALCLVLPFLTGQVPQIGNALAPMHLPVLLAGFLCGPWLGAAVGLIAPLLRYALFGMPAIFPTGISMMFELAVYGLVAGLLYRALPKRPAYVYISLVAAMLLGRIVWGIVRLLLSGVSGEPFTVQLFLGGAFIFALPGIVMHIVVVPILVFALKRAGFLDKSPDRR